ncbi:MAG TPA: hypothetical protein RMH85_03945 [Polyangiaceae bacterium LLY-WYZ-15_(1-7)]|nr:hypothetical protein [Myxococcales bacterium]MAT24726.1 hypothetical protein [Sandaracinus sp.]HJL03883.1 hypothetical protein [Polyangiaceae bacterium LLY-WYZ-15_(1-7)]MBJ72172.1 hypothetical protein [Sandaracinus sp.]HJL07619.1 hypothetical protein [Polyangiaceae bacterium LLY-WYZ-15_(1-7)]
MLHRRLIRPLLRPVCRPLLLASLVAAPLLAGCLRTSTNTTPFGPPAEERTESVWRGFPEPGALERLVGEPAPPAAAPAEEYAATPSEGWLVGVEVGAAGSPHESETRAGRLLAELVAERPGLRATGEAECMAKSIARFRAEHGGRPEEALERFLAARCGLITSNGIRSASLAWPELPEAVSTDELWAQQGDEIREHVATSGALPETGEVGIALARHGERAALVVIQAAPPEVDLDARRPAPDADGNVRLRGRLHFEAVYVGGYVNQGRAGYAACEPDRTIALPAFELVCPMAAEDAHAAIDVFALQPGRELVRGVAMLLARREGAEAARFEPLALGEPAPSEDPVAFARTFAERLNGVREAAGLAPLRLAENQSRTLDALAPHFFGLGGRDRDEAALGALAAWDMRLGETIRLGHFHGGVSAGGPDPAHWLATALSRPMARSGLLDPDVSAVSVGSVLSAEGASVLVTTHAFFDDAELGPERQRVLDAIAAARAQEGRTAARVSVVPGFQADLERVRTEGAPVGRAIDAALSSATRAWGRDVRGAVFEVGDLRRLEVPEALLDVGVQVLDVAVTFRQAEGAPWGQYVVVVLYGA